MKEIPFVKMHGLGNDFVIIDSRVLEYNLSIDEIRQISDRKTGVGCDQLILLRASSNADVAIEIFNQDGNQAEACGNGTRCVAWLIMDEAGSQSSSVETVSGILEAKLYENQHVSVNMGKPKTHWQDIPMITEMDTANIDLVIDDLNSPSAVNVGNPHIVFFVDNIDEVEIAELGPSIENHYYFPNKINVNFAEIINRNTIKLRTFERGVGLTLACGTGACATVEAAINRNLTDDNVTVIQDGGDLQICKYSNGKIEMCGKIEKSFVGVVAV